MLLPVMSGSVGLVHVTSR